MKWLDNLTGTYYLYIIYIYIYILGKYVSLAIPVYITTADELTVEMIYNRNLVAEAQFSSAFIKPFMRKIIEEN